MSKPPSRCPWCGTDPLYTVYHDTEWGRPVRDGRALWECLMLEGFQAGLNWITILRKRDQFRAAFAGFQPEIIAEWGEPDILRALADPGIVRHRGKIAATISGAQAYLRLGGGPGFSAFIWDHVGGHPVTNHLASMADAQAQTDVSAALSKALKAQGFKFCGPTICYAFMQAAGLVNDHLIGCDWHGQMAPPP